MPAPPALAEAGTQTGNPDVDDGQGTNQLRTPGGEGEGDRSAPVVADDVAGRDAQVADQFRDVAGNGLLVVTGCRLRRVAETSHVRGDDAVLPGERRHDRAPLVPGLRPAMKKDQGVTGPAGDDMQADARQLDVAVFKFRHRVPAGGGHPRKASSTMSIDGRDQ